MTPETAPLSISGIRFRREAAPVLAVVVLYAIALAVWQRGWLTSGEMYAEMATNYYHYARSGKWSWMLFALDTGYWPLPQRLISDAVFLSGVDAATTPYAYTLGAVLLGGALAGSFAHPLFRPLQRCDGTRMAIALLALFSLDFESRGFINVTYLVVLFGTALAALVATERDVDLRPWCWSLPFLMLSKPLVLILVPLAAAAAVVGRGRGRLLMLASAAAGLLQAGILAMSRLQGMLAGFGGPTIPAITKLRNGIYYGFGLAGGDVVGPSMFHPGSRRLLLGLGLALCLGSLALWWRSRRGGACLMLGGLGLAVGNGMLNATTLSGVWDSSLLELTRAGIYRWRVPAIIGAFLFVAGACEVLVSWLQPVIARMPPAIGRGLRTGLPLLLLAAWLWGTGSIVYARLITVPTHFELVHAGSWQDLSSAIDRSEENVCVPIDPVGWFYGKGCVALLPPQLARSAIAFNAGEPVAVEAPPRIAQSRLRALTVSVRPAVPSIRTARLRAVIEHAGGSSVFVGDVTLFPDGAQVFLTGSEELAGVRRLRLETDAPLMLLVDAADAPAPTITWLGQPAR